MKDPSPKGGIAGAEDDRFLNDPLLPSVCLQEQDGYFSLGLVVNWPTGSCKHVPQNQNGYNASNYEKFLSAVEAECFPKKSSKDFLVFLPFHALHITIASFVSAHSQKSALCNKSSTTESNTKKYLRDDSMASAAMWKRILQKAAQSPDWPTQPLELQVDSAQIRNRAGILLWKEHTGGIAQMRRCIQAQVENETSNGGFAFRDFRIPNIIHTTFVRYHNCDENLSWRPSQANSILLESVVSNQSLFSKGSCSTKASRASGTTDKPGIVVASVASLVNCKIYLLGSGQERDHEVFLSLPLKRNTEQAR